MCRTKPKKVGNKIHLFAYLWLLHPWVWRDMWRGLGGGR